MMETKTYEEEEIIGTGAYGTVFKARDKSNGRVVALKKIRVSLKDDGIPMSTLREIALLKHLDTFEHPNIVRLLEICHGQRIEKEMVLIMFLVFEHLDQDLATYINKTRVLGRFDTRKIKNISKQILCGVDFLHSHRIVHRDLKPQNILITGNGHVKLADFGLAKTYDFEMRLTTVVVTLWYRAPEVLLGLSYATPVDIWSVGCIIAELYRLNPLFCGNSEGDQLSKIFKIMGKPSQIDWPNEVSIKYDSFQIANPMNLHDVIPFMCENGFDLIQKMLAFNSNNRINASDALNHVYFLEEPINT